MFALAGTTKGSILNTAKGSFQGLSIQGPQPWFSTPQTLSWPLNANGLMIA
jgi:hypothetical protein